MPQRQIGPGNAGFSMYIALRLGQMTRPADCDREALLRRKRERSGMRDAEVWPSCPFHRLEVVIMLILIVWGSLLLRSCESCESFWSGWRFGRRSRVCEVRADAHLTCQVCMSIVELCRTELQPVLL